MAEADKTCSVLFNPQNVDRDAFVALLERMIEDGKHLNIVKKLLFRGKTPAEVGTSEPKLHDSLAVEFDARNPMPGEIDMLHGLIGVITEAAEMAEVLLDRVVHGQFDEVNINEEAGDVTWYLARQLRGISAKRGVEVTFEAMQRANIDKLHGRHGEAFDVFRDANRDLKTERAKLEAATPLFDPVMPEVRAVAGGNLMETKAGATPLDAIPPRVRNDPPLPAGALSAPNVGNGGENIGEDTVEYHSKRNAGDCEGMDC